VPAAAQPERQVPVPARELQGVGDLLGRTGSQNQTWRAAPQIGRPTAAVAPVARLENGERRGHTVVIDAGAPQRPRRHRVDHPPAGERVQGVQGLLTHGRGRRLDPGHLDLDPLRPSREPRRGRQRIELVLVVPQDDLIDTARLGLPSLGREALGVGERPRQFERSHLHPPSSSAR
jgi:hypothetical protein